MSAADIGRSKIEEQVAELVAVGSTIVDPDGRDFHVVSLGPSNRFVVTLNLQPKGQCGNRPFAFNRDETIRVRRKT